jgi:hypothetical protein
VQAKITRFVPPVQARQNDEWKMALAGAQQRACVLIDAF